MKIKAIIIKPNRRNDVIVLSEKKLDAGKSFVHKGCVYFVEPDHVRITDVRRIFLKFSYLTYYYMQGISKPIPFNELVYDVETPQIEEVPAKKGKTETRTTTNAKFKSVVNLGVSANEIKAMFTPWFYNIIAAKNRPLLEQINFLIMVGIALAVGYLIYVHLQAPA